MPEMEKRRLSGYVQGEAFCIFISPEHLSALLSSNRADKLAAIEAIREDLENNLQDRRHPKYIVGELRPEDFSYLYTTAITNPTDL